MIDKDLLISMEQAKINDKIRIRFKCEKSYEDYVHYLKNNGPHDNLDFTKDEYLYILKVGDVLMNYEIYDCNGIFITVFLWKFMNYLEDANGNR